MCKSGLEQLGKSQLVSVPVDKQKDGVSRSSLPLSKKAKQIEDCSEQVSLPHSSYMLVPALSQI